MSVRDRACVNIPRVPRARRRPRASRASVTRGDARASTRKLGSRRAPSSSTRARARRATRDRAPRDRARRPSRVVHRPRAIASPRDVPSYRTLVRRGKTDRATTTRGTRGARARSVGRRGARVAIGEIDRGPDPVFRPRASLEDARCRGVYSRPPAADETARRRGAAAVTPRANDEKMAGACDVKKDDDASDDARAMRERARWATAHTDRDGRRDRRRRKPDGRRRRRRRRMGG